MNSENNIAVWIITPGAIDPAHEIQKAYPESHLYASINVNSIGKLNIHRRFENLKEEITQVFSNYSGHIFIMATGIVIRMIAPLIQDKTIDPAVVTMDDQGKYTISLLSGHMGGANRLAREIAGITGSIPVITTATDVNHIPAIDLFAVERQLVIENTKAIKTINMAMLKDEPVYIYDPYYIMENSSINGKYFIQCENNLTQEQHPAVCIDDKVTMLDKDVLVLRPKTLYIGIGCNRNTNFEELNDFLKATLEDHSLSSASIQCLSSVDIKEDEKGLIDLSNKWGVPIRFYSTKELNQIKNIKNPSGMVEKHIGVKSVCEAAAILASNKGNLIVPKVKKGNVTLAVARTTSILLESDPVI